MTENIEFLIKGKEGKEPPVRVRFALEYGPTGLLELVAYDEAGTRWRLLEIAPGKAVRLISGVSSELGLQLGEEGYVQIVV